MPTTLDKEFVTIKVPKSIGAAGIKQIKEFAKRVQTNKISPKKVPQKIINELSREINAKAWERLKQKRGIA